MPVMNPDDFKSHDEDNPTYTTQFLTALEAIRKSTELLAAQLPKQIEALTKDLAQSQQPDVYRKAGEPSRGVRPGMLWAGVSGLSTLTRTTDATARASLATQGFGVVEEDDTTTGAGSAPGWMNRVTLGHAGDAAFPILRLPGAQASPRDYLNYLSSAFANKAYNRQTSLDRASYEEYQDNLTSLQNQGRVTLDEAGTPIDPTTGAPVEPSSELGQLIAPTPPKQTSLGGISDFFGSAEEGYAQGKAISGLVHNVLHPIGDLRSLGYQTGSQGSPSSFLGIRSPIDPAVMAGVGQKLSQLSFAFNNDVTPGQAGTIYSNLYGQGWLGGPQTQAMRNAAGQIMQQNPYIGSMSTTYDMMDQATRTGAMALDQFVQTMKQIPEAALAAHVNMSQMMSDMDAWGQYNKSVGGTYGQGMLNAQAWTTITGTPASIGQTALQSPLAQGQLFLRTGLLPWEHGLATGSQNIQAVMGSLSMLKGIYNPASRSTPIGNSGFSTTITGSQQQDAWIAQQTGLSAPVVNQLLTNAKGITAGANIHAEAGAYSSTIASYIQGGQLAQAREMFGGTGPGTWGRIETDLTNARDSQGHNIFEDYDYENKIRAGLISQYGAAKGTRLANLAAQKKARFDINSAGDTQALKDMGISTNPGVRGGGPLSGLVADASNLLFGSPMSPQAQYAAVQKLEREHKLSGKAMADIASARQSRIAAYQAGTTNKFGAGGQNPSGPQVTIDLGPAARKLFQLNSPGGNAKATQGGGGASVNVQVPGQSYTQPPMPNVDTAGTPSVISGQQNNPSLDSYGYG